MPPLRQAQGDGCAERCTAPFDRLRVTVVLNGAPHPFDKLRVTAVLSGTPHPFDRLKSDGCAEREEGGGEVFSSILTRLKARQAAPPQTVELAAARRPPGASALALPPWSPDDLVRRQGLEIYGRMQTDSQVATSLATKKFAVLSRGWRVLPGGNGPEDLRAADFARSALEEMRGSVEDVLFCVLDALAKGYSVSEVNYAPVKDGPWKGLVGIASIKHKDPALFDFQCDEYLNVTALLRLGETGGPPRHLPREKFILYTYMPAYEDPHGRSDLRACYKHWWAKEVILRFFCTYLERHGSPVLKGTYRRGASRGQQQELLRVLDRIQQESAIVIPEDVTVELLEAAFHGEQGFLDAIAYHDRQIAKAILGETLTQEEGQRTGALALAKVHEDTMLLRLQKVKRDLEETVMREQVLKPLTRLNFRSARIPRFLLGSLEDRSLDAQAAVLERLVRVGTVRPDEPWVREWLGLPHDPAGQNPAGGD